jgi:NDP-sugar pyrophosphorylase family protein
VLPALVLTAGLGTRLDPITRLVAKPAVPLGDRTLVERVIEWLVAQGVTNAVLNLHYRADSITSIVGDGAHLGLRVRYSWEMPILGSAGGPRHALPLLDSDTFLIVNGDSFCPIELAPMVAAHRASDAGVTMAVLSNPAPQRYSGVAIDAHDRVTGFVPRGHQPVHGPPGAAVNGTNWHFVGVQVASAALFEPLPDGVPAESVHGIYRALTGAVKRGLRAHRVSASFFDVGTPDDYLEAVLALARDRAIDPAATVAPGARVTSSVVWPGAAIGQHASLDHCIVTNVAVPAGLEARHEVLVPASVRRDDDTARIIDGIACFPMNRTDR